MSRINDDFRKIIEKDQAEQQSKVWSGTFLDYLELVREKPETFALAHRHMYEVISQAGEIPEEEKDNSARSLKLWGDTPPRVYNFFKGEFFGIEPALEKIVRYFHAAAMKGEESRQVLYLMGPVGAGKSSISEHLKRKLTEADPIFVIDGCPIREEPLHLVPRSLREKFNEMLEVQIEGELCPVCRHRLEHEFEGKYEKFPVTTSTFSRVHRRGIAVVPPVDPNNQDTSVLIGSEDISKLDKYSEGDPRVLDLNGAFNVGNRGIVEFIEVFKNETEYLHSIITATQEKFVPAPGRHGTIYVDAVILAHSNEAEWRRFRADHTNEAILDRIVTVKVPYNLRLDEEIQIYEKMLGRSGFKSHIAPHTLKVAAMFAVMSRLHKSPKCDVITKMRLYNGEDVVEKGRTKKIDLMELKEDAPFEGMSGISPRFIMKAIDSALTDSQEGITPIHIRDVMIRMVKEMDFADDIRKYYLELLQDTIHKAYLEILEKEITKAFVYAYEEQAETLFHNYLDHAEAYVNKTTLKDRDSSEDMEPDEDFLKNIEEQIAIIGSSVDGFRQEVISYLWAIGRRGKKVNYKSYDPLREAIEKKLMESVRDISRIITKARTRDEDQRQKFGDLVSNMLDRGYNEYSADVVLKYAANHLWKD
ncbi:serine protein kinase [Sneathiella sp. P13V-1]|uniref:serine protein kinase n=1 Tax=Sneathiella sp. P13V-1 TaxID=2697366 RepID=UPI00187B1D0A|nr:serine protein kinase [Sneathiella sp. P13V-1]MBE7637815.1 serine protein kinase [Sneathiella sp. P13V-1]